MLSRRRLRRPFFLEMEFLTAGAAIGWAALAYGTRVDMAQRPNLAALSFLSDDEWAVIVGSLGCIQMACVLGNTKMGRWLVSVPLAFVWSVVVLTILDSVRRGGEGLPLSTALYASLAICTLLKVARLPREFPPNG